MYTVQFGSAIYVLHAFKKKAKKGRKTPEKGNGPDQDPPRGCAAEPQQEAELMAKKTNDTNVTESSGNVFADLGFPNARPWREYGVQRRLQLHRHRGDG